MKLLSSAENSGAGSLSRSPETELDKLGDRWLEADAHVCGNLRLRDSTVKRNLEAQPQRRVHHEDEAPPACSWRVLRGLLQTCALGGFTLTMWAPS